MVRSRAPRRRPLKRSAHPHIDTDGSERVLGWNRGRRAPRVEHVLARDETIEFNIRSEASLRVGDAGALVVLINGQPARPLGANGQVLTVRFTPENFSRYLMAP